MMEGFERGSHERWIVVKLDSVSLMPRLGKAAQGMTLTLRRTMENGRRLNIVRRIVVRSGEKLRRMRVYVTVGIKQTSNDEKSPPVARRGYVVRDESRMESLRS